MESSSNNPVPSSTGENVETQGQEGDNGGGGAQVGGGDASEETEEIIGKTRSAIWEHFIRFRQNNEINARCKYCGRVIKADSGKNGTSGLNKHNARCQLYPPNIQLKEQQQAIIKFPKATNISEGGQELEIGEGANSYLWKFDQELIRRALSFMVIVDELPFSFVDGVGFKYFMSVACPKFKLPSRTTVTRDCLKRYSEEKLKLKAYFKNSSQRVSLTTDTWTSIQRINYMVLTAHYVDDNWNLQKKIINFVPIVSHKGEDIGMTIESCLREWGIEKIFTITVDNASSNDVACSYLKSQLRIWGHSICDNKYLHVRCVAHILNLVVCDGLKESSLAITRIRSLVRWVRQSPSRIAKFQECVEIEKIEKNTSLILDVSTRWNSTYSMLSVAVDFERAFNRLASREPMFKLDMITENGWPDFDDWETCRKLIVFLRYFYDMTLLVSGSSYVTSNCFFHEILDLNGALNELESEADYSMREMAKKMRSKFDKYWGNIEKMNKLLYVAVCLDPRHKLTYIEFEFNAMYGEGTEKANKMICSVRDAFQELFKFYSAKHASQTQSAQFSQSVQSSRSVQSSLNISCETTSTDFARERTRKMRRQNFSTHLSNTQGGINTELDKYLKEPIDDDLSEDKFDILSWWKNNSHRFPILSQLAKDVLGIPISTVASESAFSTGGRVLDPFRSSLTPKTVQALICTQDWLRSTKQPMTVEENLDALEKIEKGNI